MSGAAIRIAIVANAAKARSELTSTGVAATSMGSKFGKAAKSLGLLAGGGAIAGIVAIAAATKVGVTDAIAYEAAQKRSAAALKVNNGVAGQTLATLKARAASIETLTGATFDENDVLSAQSRLLRAGVTSQKAFGDATLAAANVAAAGATSIEAGGKLITKALQDPAKAAGALRKANVKLSESQQKQIKDFVEAGKTSQAQAIILGAVNKQLNGQAAALGKGSGAAFKVIQDTLQDTARDLAVKLLPAIKTVADFIAANLPAAIQFAITAFNTVKTVVSNLVPSIDTIKASFASFMTVITNPGFQIFAAFVGGIVVAFAAYSAVLAIVSTATAAYAAVQAALNVILSANPIGIIILALVGLAAALVVAYRQSEGFRDIVNAAFATIGVIASAVWTGIQAVIGAVIAVVTGYINVYKAVVVGVWTAISVSASAVWAVISAVVGGVITVITGLINAFLVAGKAVWTGIQVAAQAAWTAISAVVGGVITVITGLINALLAAGKAAWSGIQSAASAAWSAIGAVVSAAVSAIKSAFSPLVSFVSDIFGRIKDAIGDRISAARDRVTDVISSIKSFILGIDLFDAGRQLMARLGEGIISAGQAVVDKVSAIASKIKGLLPGSPIKYGPLVGWNNGGAGKKLMAMLASGIDSGLPEVQSLLTAGLSIPFPSPDFSSLPSPASAGAAGSSTVQIPVPSTLDPIEYARQILESLAAYTALNGPARIEVVPL